MITTIYGPNVMLFLVLKRESVLILPKGEMEVVNPDAKGRTFKKW